METQFHKIHPDFAAFDRVYADQFLPKLRELEGQRKEKVAKFRGQIPIILAAAMVAAIGFFILFRSPIGAFIGGAAAGGFLAFGFYQPVRKLSRKAHDYLMAELTGLLGMTYTEKDFSPPDYKAYREYRLLPSSDRKSFEDLVTGTRHDAEFSIYEAHLETVSRDSDGDETWRTVFRGQLLKIDYPKKFLGRTIISRDTGIFNRFMKPGSDYDKVGIASGRFEKEFEAWSTDQVEARDLLDPVVLERFIELENLFDGKNARAAFADGHLYLAVETGDVMKKASGFRAFDSEKRIEKLLKEFAIIYNLIDVLIKPVSGRMDGSFSIDDVHRDD